MNSHRVQVQILPNSRSVGGGGDICDEEERRVTEVPTALWFRRFEGGYADPYPPSHQVWVRFQCPGVDLEGRRV